MPYAAAASLVAAFASFASGVSAAAEDAGAASDCVPDAAVMVSPYTRSECLEQAIVISDAVPIGVEDSVSSKVGFQILKDAHDHPGPSSYRIPLRGIHLKPGEAPRAMKGKTIYDVAFMCETTLLGDPDGFRALYDGFRIWVERNRPYEHLQDHPMPEKMFLLDLAQDAETLHRQALIFRGRQSDNGLSFEGFRAFANGDASGARTVFEKTCADGDPGGCFGLGTMLRLGEGQPPTGNDPFDAIKVLRKSCDAGDQDGCAELGDMYVRGDGGNVVPRDDGYKVLYNACHAESGLACSFLARTYLGYTYYLIPDRARAHYAEACRIGFAPGCLAEGLFEWNGIGGPRVQEDATDKFRLACDKGIAEACGLLPPGGDASSGGAEHMKP